MTIKEIRTKYGMTQNGFSQITGVPVRTIQNWEGGQRSCPQYVLDLIEFKLDTLCDNAMSPADSILCGNKKRDVTQM